MPIACDYQYKNSKKKKIQKRFECKFSGKKSEVQKFQNKTKLEIYKIYLDLARFAFIAESIVRTAMYNLFISTEVVEYA